jgi:hypothetical protein
MAKPKPNDSAPQGTYSTAVIAKFLKISEPYLLDLAQKRIVPQAIDPKSGKEIQGRWHLVEANHAYIDFLRDQVFGRNAEGTKWREARTRVMVAEANQAELRYGEARGELLRVDDVKELFAAVWSPCVGRLHAFRGMATQRLIQAGVIDREGSKEVFAIVDALIRTIIEELKHDSHEAIAELIKKREAVAKVSGNGEHAPG